jgi:uncharacterized protein YbcI
MDETRAQGTSALIAVSNALVKLHKEQFGRGPTNARSYFAGPDALLCVLEEVLLPAERKLVQMGHQDQVRDSRTSFQAATSDEFIAAIEEIVHRKVHAFASGVDADANVVFESFWIEPHSSSGDGTGTPVAEQSVRGAAAP